jgi:FkbM family methyltransferase
MRDHSQNGEQKAILDYLDRLGVGKGRLLDIGAHDGLQLSNSAALIEDRGWGGVLVEPSPGPFAELLKRRGGVEGVHLVNAVVVPSTAKTGELVEFHDSGGDFVSSLDKTHVAKWSHAAKFRPYFAPALNAETLVRRFGEAFDFVSIDAEALSVDIFLSLIGLLNGAFCWIVEHDGRADQIVQAASKHGYRELLRNTENVILVI